MSALCVQFFQIIVPLYLINIVLSSYPFIKYTIYMHFEKEMISKTVFHNIDKYIDREIQLIREICYMQNYFADY